MFELGRQVERRFTDAVRRVDVHLRQKLFQIAARAALRRLVQNPVASPLVVDVSAAEEAQQPDPSIHVIHGRAAAAPAAVLDHLVIDAVLLLHIQGGQDEVVEARVLGHVAHERQRQLDPRLVVARRVTVRVLVVANYRQSTTKSRVSIECRETDLHHTHIIHNYSSVLQPCYWNGTLWSV